MEALFFEASSFVSARWLSILESLLQTDLCAVIIALTNVDLRVVLVRVSVTMVSSVVPCGGVSIKLFLSLVLLESVAMIDVKALFPNSSIYGATILTGVVLYTASLMLNGMFCEDFLQIPM